MDFFLSIFLSFKVRQFDRLFFSLLIEWLFIALKRLKSLILLFVFEKRPENFFELFTFWLKEANFVLFLKCFSWLFFSKRIFSVLNIPLNFLILCFTRVSLRKGLLFSVFEVTNSICFDLLILQVLKSWFSRGESKFSTLFFYSLPPLIRNSKLCIYFLLLWWWKRSNIW